MGAMRRAPWLGLRVVALGLSVTVAAHAGSSAGLVSAARSGNLGRLKAACAHGCDVDAAHGEALRVAAGNGHAAAVSFLLSKGAWANKVYPEAHETPLMMAALRGRTEVVRLLLDAGANVNHCSDESTALGFAASNGHLDTVRLLVSRGANVNLACASAADTPLRLAQNSGAVKVAEFLEERGGETPSVVVWTEDELVVVPGGYVGPVGVIFDREYGLDVKREGNQRILPVDANGILCADAPAESSSVTPTVAFVAAAGGRTPAHEIASVAVLPIVRGRAPSGTSFIATAIRPRSGAKPDDIDLEKRMKEMIASDYCRRQALKNSRRSSQ